MTQQQMAYYQMQRLNQVRRAAAMQAGQWKLAGCDSATQPVPPPPPPPSRIVSIFGTADGARFESGGFRIGDTLRTGVTELSAGSCPVSAFTCGASVSALADSGAAELSCVSSGAGSFELSDDAERPGWKSFTIPAGGADTAVSAIYAVSFPATRKIRVLTAREGEGERLDIPTDLYLAAQEAEIGQEYDVPTDQTVGAYVLERPTNWRFRRARLGGMEGEELPTRPSAAHPEYVGVDFEPGSDDIGTVYMIYNKS